MTALTPKGFTYPLDTDPLADVAEWIMTLATELDQAVGARRSKRQRGSYTTSASGVLTIPHTLPGIPTWVSAQPYASSLYAMFPQGADATNITVVVRQITVAGAPVLANTGVTCQWQASL